MTAWLQTLRAQVLLGVCLFVGAGVVNAQASHEAPRPLLPVGYVALDLEPVAGGVPLTVAGVVPHDRVARALRVWRPDAR